MTIQPSVIDVDGWDDDDAWGMVYPEGARAKRLLTSPAIPPWEGIKSNWRYLFKRSDKRYPQQLWGEVIAYQLGLILNISVPPAHVAFSTLRQQSAALIEWFYLEGETFFVPAGSIFQRLIPGFDREKGRQHNFVDAVAICRGTVGEGWRDGLADMLFLDTLLGNSDRHQENWGFLVSAIDLENTKEDNQLNFRFAPWFDNGTSLGCERWPGKVATWNDAQLGKYVTKGCHHFRSNRDDDKRLGHMELLRMLVAQNHTLVKLLQDRMRRFDIGHVDAVLEQLGQLPLPEPLDGPRRNWIRRLIQYRAIQMKDILL